MSHTCPGQIRIIAGQWRGRKIFVLDHATLRPTPNRIRETVFNWLAPYIQDAVCLDAFAGSGALGFEALSRGAAQVVMIENSPVVMRQLKETAKQFNAENISFYQNTLPDNSLQLPLFDIVFLDPPFHKNLIINTCASLEQMHCLKTGTLMYIESEENLLIDAIGLPNTWEILKTKKTGQVGYHLIRVQ